MPQPHSFIRATLPPFVYSLLKSMRDRLRELRGTAPAGGLPSALKVRHDELNQNVPRGEMVLREGLRFKIHPESMEPYRAFSYIYPEMVEEMDGFLSGTKAQQRLLDVGALHGVFSLAFVAGHPDKRSLAVDASPIAFARLLYNIHHNAKDQVQPVECALTEENKTLFMHYEWEHAVAAGTTRGEADAIPVRGERGDDVCREHDFAPDVIKIDVEGHEIKVLKGLRQTIENHKPLIFLELHPGRIMEENDSIKELIALLNAWKYKVILGDGSSATTEALLDFTSDQRVVLSP